MPGGYGRIPKISIPKTNSNSIKMTKVLYRIMTIFTLVAVSSFALQGCGSGDTGDVYQGGSGGNGGGSGTEQPNDPGGDEPEEITDPIDWTVDDSKDQVVLLVKRDLYTDLSAEIEQYKQDVETAFPSVQLNILQGAWTNAAQVRETIKKVYNEKTLDGVVLVGNMPMHKFYMHDQENPNPLYYEDFDMVFDDDVLARQYGSEPAPKVWVSNLRAVSNPNLKGTTELKAFFQKTHKYYTGALQINHKALFIAGWEWPGGAKDASTSMTTLFPNGSDRVVYTYEGGADPGTESTGATLTNYKSAFEQNWTLFYIQVHSFPKGHDFDNGGHISSTEVSQINTSAVIAINHGCSGGNYLGANPEINLTQAYVFSEGVGQCALGQVRTGMVYGHEKVYERLCAGDYMGKAYFECKKAAESQMYSEYPDGTVIGGVIMYGNPFVKIEADE